MRPLLQVIPTAHTPESLVETLCDETGVALLRTGQFDSPSARYSFVTANPFLVFKSFGSRCEVFSVGPDAALGDALELIMRRRIGVVPVLDSKRKLLGQIGRAHV